MLLSYLRGSGNEFLILMIEVATGFEPVWTALQAAASPLGHSTGGTFPPGDWRDSLRADDGIRTRDPHLGKVMRYHCATSARSGTSLPGPRREMKH